MPSAQQRRLTYPLALMMFLLPAAAALAQNPSVPAPVTAHSVWLGADGNPLLFQTDEEILAFLRTAEIVQEEKISTGVTRPRKLTLSKDGIRAHAVFRYLNEDKASMTFSDGQTELMFRDSYLFEPAAYELSRLLGLGNIPPAAIRNVGGVEGSIQIWIERAMTEEKRAKQDLQPPDWESWQKQGYVRALFDALIFNTDRNRSNVLITPDWKLWMIDHTRAFRRRTGLPGNPPAACDRVLYRRLQTLDAGTVRARLRPYLRNDEITALLKRRDLIVTHLQKLIAEKGESAVLFTLAP